MAINFKKYVGLRKALLIIGVVAIILSFLLFFGCLVGLLSFETFSILGNPGLRSLASIAVMGCMLAALGSWYD